VRKHATKYKTVSFQGLHPKFSIRKYLIKHSPKLFNAFKYDGGNSAVSLFQNKNLASNISKEYHNLNSSIEITGVLLEEAWRVLRLTILGKPTLI
jgi:hypothetical protein